MHLTRKSGGGGGFGNGRGVGGGGKGGGGFGGFWLGSAGFCEYGYGGVLGGRGVRKNFGFIEWGGCFCLTSRIMKIARYLAMTGTGILSYLCSLFFIKGGIDVGDGAGAIIIFASLSLIVIRMKSSPKVGY